MEASGPELETPVRPRAGGDERPDGGRTKRRKRYRAPALEVRELALDAAILAAAAVAVRLGAGADAPANAGAGWMAGYSLGVLVLLAYFGLYRPHFAHHFLEDLRTIIAATAVAAMALTFVTVLVTDDPSAASQAVRAWVFSAAYLAAGRGGVQLMQARRRRQGLGGERTLIVGAGRIGFLAAQRLLDRPEFGLRPVAFLDHDPLHTDEELGLPVFGREITDPQDPKEFAGSLEQIVRERDIRHVIIAFSLSSHEVDLALVRRCQELQVTVSLVPRLFGGLPDQTSLERLGGLPLVTVRPADPHSWQFAIKYGLDRVAAVLLIVLLSPLLALSALAILITMGRPIFFRQPRVGIDGEEFEMLKLRTMRPAAVGDNGPIIADLQPGLAPGGIEGEDRRTPVGAFLRRCSLDELPQFFNVLRGQMSVVGPRPERPEFVREFDLHIHRYVDRSRVKSGITGWAQVHGLRGKTSVADRAEWDNYYIENWSLWLDFKILLLTFAAVFRRGVE